MLDFMSQCTFPHRLIRPKNTGNDKHIIHAKGRIFYDMGDFNRNMDMGEDSGW